MLHFAADENSQFVAVQNVPALPEPFGPGYPVVFDKTIATAGFSEVRIWVHVFVVNYAATPVTSATQRVVRLMHPFGPGESFDYERDTLTSQFTSYIDGYVARPIIGNRLRVLCHPENLPPGPYNIYATYYLVR